MVAPRGRGDARRGARRPGADQWLSARCSRAPRCAGGAGATRTHPPALPAHALGFLREHVGVAAAPRAAGRARRSVALRAVRAAGASARARCARSSAPSGVRDDHAERVLHAAGKGYPDLVRLRAGEPRGRARRRRATRATHEQLRARARAVRARARSRSCRSAAARASSAASRRCAARTRAVIALDLRAHRRRARARPRVADGHRAGAGMRAPALERELARARAHARPLPAVLRVRLARRLRGDALGRAGVDRLRRDRASWCSGCAWPRRPARSSCRRCRRAPPGPALRQLLVGSEGTLGVITELALRVRPAPARARLRGRLLRGASRPASRRCARSPSERARPTWRGSPTRHETRMSLALAGSGGLKGRLGRAYLRRARLRRAAAWRSSASRASRGGVARGASARSQLRARARRPAGRALARARPGCAGRFAAPYLRDELLDARRDGRDARDRHAVVEPAARCTARSAARSSGAARRGTPGLVMCHISHLYETRRLAVLHVPRAPARGRRELEQWQAVKRAASEAIVAGGGTITHHHAVGRDHAPWMAARGRRARARARCARSRSELDPAGIMNPGKLLPTRLARRGVNGAAQHDRARGASGCVLGLAREQDHRVVLAGVARQQRAALQAAARADCRARG